MADSNGSDDESRPDGDIKGLFGGRSDASTAVGELFQGDKAAPAPAARSEHSTLAVLGQWKAAAGNPPAPAGEAAGPGESAKSARKKLMSTQVGIAPEAQHELKRELDAVRGKRDDAARAPRDDMPTPAAGVLSGAPAEASSKAPDAAAPLDKPPAGLLGGAPAQDKPAAAPAPSKTPHSLKSTQLGVAPPDVQQMLREAGLGPEPTPERESESLPFRESLELTELQSSSPPEAPEPPEALPQPPEVALGLASTAPALPAFDGAGGPQVSMTGSAEDDAPAGTGADAVGADDAAEAADRESTPIAAENLFGDIGSLPPVAESDPVAVDEPAREPRRLSRTPKLSHHSLPPPGASPPAKPGDKRRNLLIGAGVLLVVGVGAALQAPGMGGLLGAPAAVGPAAEPTDAAPAPTEATAAADKPAAPAAAAKAEAPGAQNPAPGDPGEKPVEPAAAAADARAGAEQPEAVQQPGRAEAPAKPEAKPAVKQDEPASAEAAVDPEAGDTAAPEPAAAGNEDVANMKPRAIIAAAKKRLGSDRDGAIALLQQGLSVHERDHHIAELLAEALLGAGRAQDALPHAAFIVRRRSKRASYRVLFGDVLSATGDRAKAREQWERALELEPDNADAKRRLQ